MFTIHIILILCSLTQGADWNDNADLGKSGKELARNDYAVKGQDDVNSEMFSDPFLNSDDLFSELNNIWAKKGSKREQVTLVQREFTLKDNVSALRNLPQQPFTEMSDFANYSTDQPTSTDQYDDNHWSRFKVIMKNMKSLMIKMYGNDISTGNDMVMFRLLDKLLEIGDRMNMINSIQDNFDPDLLSFLKKKWSFVEGNLLESYPLLSYVLAVDVKDLFMMIAKGLANQFGSLFHKQALKHLNELDFILRTMRSSGFKDSEIYDVFMLLGLPTEDLITTSNTLETEARSYGITSLFSRSSHGGGHEGGYGYKMMTKDPFLILAGLALAAFAAYLIYRLLTTTTGMRKRSVSNDILSLDLSDMPEVMTNLHRWLDNADILYGNFQNPDNNSNNKDSFSYSVNQLWRSLMVDKLSGSCIRRYLCQHIHDNKFQAISSGLDLEQLALIGLAELLGEEGAGKIMDEYITKVNNDEEIDCHVEVDSCDE